MKVFRFIRNYFRYIFGLIIILVMAVSVHETFKTSSFSESFAGYGFVLIAFGFLFASFISKLSLGSNHNKSTRERFKSAEKILFTANFALLTIYLIMVIILAIIS